VFGGTPGCRIQLTATDFNHFGGIDGNAGFDWLAQQNGGQFDPQLFGDYREPQDHILANANFDDLLADVDADFFVPYNMPPVLTPATQKKSLMAEIDAKQDADDEPAKPSGGKEKYRCPEVWYVLSRCRFLAFGFC
jgi:AP-1-like transcription factor